MPKRLDIIRTDLQPEDFIIPARNTRGEKDRQWFSCSPELDRAISVIVASHKFPFKTEGDCLRFCAHYGILWLEKQAGVTTSLQQTEMMFQFLRDEELQQQCAETLQVARNVVDRYTKDGDHTQARRVVADLRAKALAQPPGYWREKYVKAIDDAFGHLVDGQTHAVSGHRFRVAGKGEVE